MSAITFAGLASGIDSTSLISALVNAERQPATIIQGEQSDLNTQKSIVNSLASAVSSLGSLASGMNLAPEVQPRTATSSDSHVSVTASTGAAATTHDVRVKQLARGQIASSNTFASDTAGIAGTGSIDISVAGTTNTVSWDSTMSLSDIAGKINDASLGATASVLYDGSAYRLVVTQNGVGTANAPQFSGSSDTLGLSDPANIKIPAQDAIVSLDGIDVTRGKNVIDDAISGVTLTLNSVTGASEPDGSVAVTQDNTALTKQVQALVNAYNSVNGALHVQLDYNGTKKGTDTLFGDSTLRQLQGALGSLMSSQYGSMTLSDLGMSRDKDGVMTLDTSKLSDALSSNPDAVKNLFVTNGFASAITTMTDAYTRAGDGILVTKAQSLTDRFTDLQTQADQINTNADALQTRLQNQFAALESAMSTLKSQQQQLSQILG